MTSKISITPLLKELTSGKPLSPAHLAQEIASALSLMFDDQLTPEQCASLLTCLRLKGLDEDPQVIAACAQSMRSVASNVPVDGLRKAFELRVRPEGRYRGGLCDIVGTGGDGHSTFNVSTTASIISSALVIVAKHGAQASSSKSGSADVLMAIKPKSPCIEAITASTITKIYEKSNYGFLFAKQFHPGMRHVAPIRKEIGFRTIFNILGPLANPLHQIMEAGVYGVYKKSLGPVYADALRLCGVKKAMVICGDEDLDEISCAGKTQCWKITTNTLPEAATENGAGNSKPPVLDNGFTGSVIVEHFELNPSDFGIEVRSLAEVGPGRGPDENAELLVKMLKNDLDPNHPTLGFVLMNAAALLVVSGICDSDSSQMGPGDDGKVVTEKGPGGGRWKEGMRRARWAIESGAAFKSLIAFVDASRSLSI